MGGSAVIFDIGNVLVDWDVRQLFARIEQDPARLEYFLAEVVPLSWHHRFDLGELMADGVQERAKAYPDYADLLTVYNARFDETINGVIEGTLHVLKDLDAAGYPLFALSNFPADKWEEFERDYAFTRAFKNKVISGREGIAKPDRAIYAMAHERFGVEPGETLFIDDRIDNIRAAGDYGFQTHLFESPDKLESWLRSNGWLASRSLA